MSVIKLLARVSVCVAPMLAGLLLAEPAVAKPGADVYGTHPKIQRLRISPEGGYVAMIGNVNNQDVVSISKVGGGLCNVGNGGNNIREIYWGNENRLIVIATRTTKLPDDYESDELFEFGQSFTMNTNCGDIKQVKGHGFLAHLSDGHILMTVETFNNATSAEKNLRRKKESWFKTDIFKIDPNTGGSERVEEGKDLTEDWIVDAQGNAKIRIDVDRRVNRIAVFARIGGSKEWEQVYDGHGVPEPDQQLAFLDVGPQPDTAYVASRNGSLWNLPVRPEVQDHRQACVRGPEPRHRRS